MTEKKIGILLTSHNNYDFMEKFWILHNKNSFLQVLNIDDDSCDEQKIYGRELCKRSGIVYIDRDDRGLQNNLKTASKYFYDVGCKFVLWFQHDCWPIDNSFYTTLNNLVLSGKLDDFGVIGFNGLSTDVVNNYESQLRLVERGEKPLGILARCILGKGYIYYSGFAGRGVKVLPNLFKFTKPFSVEVVEYFAALLNIERFFKYIKPTDDFHYFMAWDDLCFQFLRNNVHNIILPDCYVLHRPDLKVKSGISSRATNAICLHHDKVGKDISVWFKRWGWNRKDRNTFDVIKGKYKNSLLYNFYNHNLKNGPLKVFDL